MIRRIVGPFARLAVPRVCVRTGVVLPLRFNSQVSKSQSVSESREVLSTVVDEDIPWFMRDESTSPLIDTKEIEIPSIPENAPETVEEFLKLVAEEYGLQDIQLFDLTSLPESHPSSTKNQAASYIIICTGKSEKHIYKASSELRLNIKHSHDILPSLEGVVSGGTSPAARRRLLKRVRRGAPATDNDYGKVPNSWVMCDTKVDNIFIHILTQQRRDELNLESLWCRDEEKEKYLPSSTSVEESDDIFIGVRRGFHTMTPFWAQQRRSYSTKKLHSIQQLFNEDSSISEDKLQSYKNNFDSNFVPRTVQAFRDKFELYRTIHVLNPSLVSFEQVRETILEKYSSLDIYVNKDFSITSEKVEDVIRYMKLIIDSPEIAVSGENTGVFVDRVFDSVSKFISTLVSFSYEQVNVLEHDEFLPLLWRLTLIEKDDAVLNSEVITRAIQGEVSLGTDVFRGNSPISQASNKARDVINIAKYFSELNQVIQAVSFKELVLFSYGNAGKWSKFWNEWEVSFGFFGNGSPQAAVHSWVRLVVYLALRDNKTQQLHFLHNYWNNSGLSRSIVSDLERNECRFGSPTEKRVFISAINKIVDSVNNSNNDSKKQQTGFAEVKAFIERL
ncbi:hypothetical protein G9P44_003004 [Scheffersomyces stipitis]|nr:hypothetical protein G9P44_003004 [Scheffersomyces stipitis]